jgi:branched-chain amino acid transport system substrate-binding protein
LREEKMRPKPNPQRRPSRAGLFLTAVAAGCLAMTGCNKDKVLKIGHITTDTGSESYIGPASTGALQDYIDKLNAAGGINGYKLQLVSYDSRTETPEAVSIAKRLIDQDHVVAVIGPSWSGAGIPVAAIADQAKVPFVATTATNVNVTVNESGQVHPYMFRACFIDPYQGYALADYAYRKLNLRKVAFLADVTSPYTTGVHKFFAAHFQELGGQVALAEGYSKGDAEFRAQLAKIKNSKADLLVCAADNYKDPGLIAQQSEALGLKITFMGSDGWFVDDLLPMAGKQLDGAYLSAGVSTDAPEFASFNADYLAKHKVKANMWTYFCLDAMMMIEHGIRQATANGGKPDPTAIRDAIEGMKDVQVFTSKCTVEKDTHNPHNKPLVILQIKDSKWKVLETFKPE